MATYDLTSVSMPATLTMGDILNCPYTGNKVSITLPAGRYYLECWGAQGGYRSSQSYGGNGGYSKGVLTLEEATNIYLYAGGRGGNSNTNTNAVRAGGFNGGGYRYGLPGGGGASDIRIGTDSLYTRVIVAGGGGSDGSAIQGGGAGGGVYGQIAPSGFGYGGLGGQSTYSGTDTSTTATTQATSGLDTSTVSLTYGGFGFGGAGLYVDFGYGGAGGGGWYGGQGTMPDDIADNDKGGGGGSGFVYTKNTASSVPIGYLLSGQYYLTQADTKQGTSSFISPNNTTEIGHSGDGYVRITVGENINDLRRRKSARIQQKGSSSTEWDPDTILLSREIGIETDTNKMKIGDGITPWSLLPYFNSSTSASNEEIKRIKYYGDPDIIPSDESYFIVNTTGETITGLTDAGKAQTELVIPYEIDGKEITSITNAAFGVCTSLISVNIPNSVTSIGDGAFYDCISLTSINIPNSVTSIGNGAFSDCTNLTIYCEQGSYADKYAKQNNISVVYTDVKAIALVGQKTVEGGEIFNDYTKNKALGTNSHAEGANTKAGGYGYKIIAAENGSDGIGTYTLSSITGLEVGMRYSVRLATAKYDAGAITAIDNTNNKITVDNYPNIALETDADNPSNYIIENYLTIVSRPDLGDTEIGFNSHAEGRNTIAQDVDAHAEGRDTKAIGQYGHAEGRNTKAAYAAHAEGRDNVAIGDVSHAEGHKTQALGKASHTEGIETIAQGRTSHAEGYKTTAMEKGHAEGVLNIAGYCAHAEGEQTQANGPYTHTEGYKTIASGKFQHIQGKFNIEDTENKYAHIIGNGHNDAERSNAHTVDWDGNAWFAGDVKAGDVSLQSLMPTVIEGLNSKADKATTLSGYGITDTYTKEEVDDKFDDIDIALDRIISIQNELMGVSE